MPTNILQNDVYVIGLGNVASRRYSSGVNRGKNEKRKLWVKKNMLMN